MKELTLAQKKTLERVLKRKKEAMIQKLSHHGDYGEKICKGCGQPFKITCKANIKGKLYCKDSCKFKRKSPLL
jgi:hypothetical protein